MGDRHFRTAEVLEEEYRALRPAAVVSPECTLDIPCADDAEGRVRLAAIQHCMLQDQDGLSALCLSGGGIRSATFNLGVIQGLAKLGLLERFDYLSTVSGGGYIGAWLSAWAQRHPQGIVGVSAELRGPPPAGAPADPEPVHQLRDYSNYLAPRFGAMSIDTWTLIATYLRNLTLNWLVIIPLLSTLLLVPRLYAALLVAPIHPLGLLLMALIIAGLMWAGLRYIGMDRPSAGGLNRTQGEFLRGCLLPLGASVLLISLGWIWIHRGNVPVPHWLIDWPFIIGLSALVYLGGLLTFWAARNSSNKGHATGESEEQDNAKKDWNVRIAQWMLQFTAPLSVVAVLILLVYLTDWIFGLRSTDQAGAHLALIYTVHPISLLGFAAAALAISGAMAKFINVNRFSLHAMYRNRLIRAYLGASRRKANADPTDCGTLHPFTGFDADDNLQIHELWPGSDSQKQPARRIPFLVVNIALNLVQSQCLAWQQRKAAAFSVTPLHAGGGCVGYRRVNEYGGEKGISLGTAMTISGAAASPNMGYQTTTALAFLMGLFNARLGWWLGNPANEDTWRKPGPDFSVTPLINEMLGLTREDNPWVYLSDGGHFDNLGLYEMVQRRCRLMVVCDAGADPCGNFEDLGNAIRKIRADFGIGIEMESPSIGIGSQKRGQTEGHYCALFRVDYGTEITNGSPQTGQILYIKPALYGCEPMDIFNYAREHPAFPHEPTSDQFFSESQFESYRRLGEYIVGRLVTDSQGPVTTLEEFIAAGRSHCGLKL